MLRSHHGFFQSGSAALVHGIAPRVAIMDNGAKKGGSPVRGTSLRSRRGWRIVVQLHYSEEAGRAQCCGGFSGEPAGAGHGELFEG